MTVPERWLEPYDYDELRAITPTDLPPLPEPPSTDVARTVPVEETGSALVKIPDDLATYHAYLELGSPAMPRVMLAREEVIDRIRRAEAALPAPFTFLILDTWRSVEAQAELARIYKQKYPDLDARYIADASDTELIAPHTMGAAVDLTLCVDGQGLPLGADFDQFDESAGAMYLERLEDPSPQQVLDRDLRRLLSHTMFDAGFAPLDSEWWHFSYGDQRWATFTGSPASLYGRIEA